ncbi:hypothetical protein E3T35_02135 [Cryobacterium sp. TMT1-2-2]|uniref:hypothetical protein n=1 Tax=Cryobacterium sp. TMT1-2-2 TaxID=1259233 RepID=UPI00106B256B|nr:hypothetical protein [Cryobacterium sp. TMT1-2-2]TFD15187.1 hypothetical protein E3T35_02135 [Cryobacterium sp. TMT1-2-2]
MSGEVTWNRTRPPTKIPTLGGPTVLASGLLLPLSLGVGAGGTAYVSQNALGVLTKVSLDGTTSVVASANPGDELGAVSVRNGTVYYSTNTQDHTASALYSIRRHLPAQPPMPKSSIPTPTPAFLWMTACM